MAKLRIKSPDGMSCHTDVQLVDVDAAGNEVVTDIMCRAVDLKFVAERPTLCTIEVYVDQVEVEFEVGNDGKAKLLPSAAPKRAPKKG